MSFESIRGRVGADLSCAKSTNDLNTEGLTLGILGLIFPKRTQTVRCHNQNKE